MAVIGSGPAGLTVAGDLARQGFNVTIFEGQAEPGGVLMYGIPEYRLPKSVVRDEVSKIEALGVQFITNCMVGENNVTIDSLSVQDMMQSLWERVRVCLRIWILLLEASCMV